VKLDKNFRIKSHFNFNAQYRYLILLANIIHDHMGKVLILFSHTKSFWWVIFVGVGRALINLNIFYIHS